MKRVIGLVFICGAASCIAPAISSASPVGGADATKHAYASVGAHKGSRLSPKEAAALAAKREAEHVAALRRLAPGDEYFGPLKQSIIGIRNTLRDLGLRYDVNHDIAKQTFASAELTERSIRDWEKKYPKDTQLPRAVYLLQRLYTKVLSQESRDRARLTARWMESDFKKTPQEKQLIKTLALEHLAPLPKETAAPPAATTFPSEFGPGYPSEFSPSGTPVRSAPATTSSPAASRPATPPKASPEATGSPSASGAAGPSPSPAPTASAVPSATPKH